MSGDDNLEAVFSAPTLAAALQFISQRNGDDRKAIVDRLLQLATAANFSPQIEQLEQRHLHWNDDFSTLQSELSFPGNKLNANARCSMLMWIVRKTIGNTDVWPLTRLRLAVLHQSLLEEAEETIAREVDELEANTSTWKEALASLDTSSQVEYHLLRAQLHTIHLRPDLAILQIQDALTLSAIRVELVGTEGKRTRFQERDIAQLVATLVDESTASSGLSTPLSSSDFLDSRLPKSSPLTDDTVLDGVRRKQEATTPQSTPRLSGIRSACALAACQSSRRQCNRSDVLADEQALATLEVLIQSSGSWAVSVTALMMRSSLEKTSSRRVERALAQVEGLCSLQTESISVEECLRRSSLALAVGQPTHWRMQAAHAELLQSLGCHSEALSIYERIHDWDRTIGCFRLLGQLDKAEGLVRRQIEQRPEDEHLYCLLGDITNQSDYYHKAIAVSQDRSARAHKALGLQALLKENWEEALRHYRRSAELQPIQLGVWFNVGHCAAQLERFDEAAAALHRCVTYEPEHFEAWNNLAAAYAAKGMKQRAALMLEEAVKWSFENTRVWINYAQLCADTGQLKKGLQAAHHCLDLSSKFDDPLVVGAFVQLALDSQKNGDAAAIADTAKLLGRMAATQKMSAELWRHYAHLKSAISAKDEVEHEKYVQLLEKLVQAEISESTEWRQSAPRCLAVLRAELALAEERLKLAGRKASPDAAVQQARSRIRLSLRNMLAGVKRQADGRLGTDDEKSRLHEMIDEADELLKSLAAPTQEG